MMIPGIELTFGASTALPALRANSIFKTPEATINAITLAAGDEVWPLTLTEICKVDIEISGEMGTIDATDSCDYPYMVNLADDFVNYSGSINTMMRFDEDTEEIVPVTKELLNKFVDVIDDDGEGTYTLSEFNSNDLYLMILLNSDNADTDTVVSNWMILPAVLTSNSMPIGLKDVIKNDFSWSKGQGPAQYYSRTNPA